MERPFDESWTTKEPADADNVSNTSGFCGGEKFHQMSLYSVCMSKEGQAVYHVLTVQIVELISLQRREFVNLC